MNRARESVVSWTPFWTLVLSLSLLVVIGMYVLVLVQDEHIHHLWDTSVIDIISDDQVFFGRDHISRVELVQKVNAFRDQQGTGQVLHIRADRSVRYSTVVLLIRMIQDAGQSGIGLGLSETIEMHTSPHSLGPELSVMAVECSSAALSPVVTVGVPDSMVDIDRVATAGLPVELFLNSKPVSELQLSSDLAQIVKQQHEKMVYVGGAGQVEYGEVADVMRIAHKAGATKIGLIPDCRQQHR